MCKQNKINEFVHIVTSKGEKVEKQRLVVRAIMENQKKFLRTCKLVWGPELYSEIVADC